MSTATFLNLNQFGLNPAAVAWYEFFAAGQTYISSHDETERVGPAIKLVLLDGALFEAEDQSAQALYDHLQQAGTSILPLSEEKQNALDSLKAFFATGLRESSIEDFDSFYCTSAARETAEQALSVLGA